MALGDPRDPGMLESGLESRELVARRRVVPIPYREGLRGLLQGSSNMSARANPEIIGEAVTDIMAQFPFEGLSRPPITGVNVRRDLPALASHMDFVVRGDPKATERLKKEVQAQLRGGKYAITKPEWQGAARLIDPVMDQLDLIMNLGVASGPGLHRVNARDAIIVTLWNEALSTTPESADVSAVRNRNAKLRTLGKLAVAREKKLKGTAFGMTSRELGEAYPVVADVLAPSIGLRGTRGHLLEPRVLGEGPLQPILGVVGKDVRARKSQESGAARRIVADIQKDPEVVYRKTMDLLQEEMNPRDFGIFTRQLQQQGVPTMPIKSRLTAVIQTMRDMFRNPEYEFTGNYEDLGQKLTERLSGQPAKTAKKTSLTRMSKQLVTDAESGLVATSREGMKILQEEAARMKGRVNPLIAKGLGPAPFLLALASIISAGLVASGTSREEAA
jgi:hypothetical protein